MKNCPTLLAAVWLLWLHSVSIAAFRNVPASTLENPGIAVQATSGLTGTVVATQTTSFATLVAANPVTGVLRTMVVNPTGLVGAALDFYYHITNTTPFGSPVDSDIWRLAIGGCESALMVSATFRPNLVGIAGAPADYYSTPALKGAFSADRDPGMDGGTELRVLCFRTETIQVPLYLIFRHLAHPGTTQGPCASAANAEEVIVQTFIPGGVGIDFDSSHSFNSLGSAPGNIYSGQTTQWLVVRTNQATFRASDAMISAANGTAVVSSFGPAPASTDADADGLRDVWELSYWPTTVGHSASDDLDRDGLTELQELGFGLNPTIADSSLQPAVIAEGGYLTITLTKRSGSAYEVQSAGTLLTGQPASFNPATTVVLLNNTTTLKVRDNFLIGTPPARFLRVKVIAAP